MTKRPATKHRSPPPGENAPLAPPRIVGGRLRGRKLLYSGDPLTRPMKDRVREAVFNLVGPAVQGKHALDLFAGTGALGFEALSRGAAWATFLERHFPTADLIRRTATELSMADQCQVIAANTLIWARRDLPAAGLPWVAFVSPPWSLFHDQPGEMIELIAELCERCPAESVVVVEADESFDFARLPQADQWDVRPYPPAVVGIWRCRTNVERLEADANRPDDDRDA